MAGVRSADRTSGLDSHRDTAAERPSNDGSRRSREEHSARPTEMLGAPFQLSTGHSFDTVEALVSALEAAFEVNDHLNSEVEKQTLKLSDAEHELKGLRLRCQQLSELVKSEREHAHPEDPTAAVQSVDGTAAAQADECIAQELCGSWTDPKVYELFRAVLEKGRTQGWLINPDEVQLGPRIGGGSFGTTYVAEWRGAKVAVKSTGTPETAADALNFLREIDAFACLKHPNILPFVGAVLNRDGHCWLITEFMECGTLRDWLYGANGNPMRPPHRPLSARLDKALQVAQGMSALEALDPPICHRDLKPSNVFLNVGDRCCIADMNLARRLTDESFANLTGETGTYLYMSPEMMRHDPYSTKTDVFSFGVMLSELCSQRMPYQSLYLTPLQVAMGVTEGLRPPLEAWVKIPSTLRQLIDQCLREDPFERPNFVKITPVLRDVVAGIRAAEASEAAAGSLFGRVSGFMNTQQAVLQKKGRDTMFGFMNRK